MNEFIVVQCKNYTKTMEKKDFEKQLHDALNLFDQGKLPFFSSVERFYFVSAIDRDTNFSNYEI